MEGLGIFFALLIFLYFIAFLFSALLVLHFFKIKPNTSVVILIGVLALVVSIIFISSDLMLNIPFGALLMYALCALVGYMFFVGFSSDKTVPGQKEEG